jgi:hypothetical protein
MSKRALEKSLEEKGCDYAESRGWFQCKFVSPSINAMPDRFHMRKGRVVFIEYKREDEVPTAQQLKRHRDLRAQGAEVYWVDNLQAAMDILR